MRTRLIAPLAVLFLVLAGAASAAATTGVFESNDSRADNARDLAERDTAVTGATTPTSPTVSLPETSLPPNTVALAPGTTQTFAAGDAGSVTIGSDAGSLTVLSANANPGFTSEVERGSGTEVEVQFANGTVRVDFNAELEDGAVRVRVRVSDVAVDDPGTTPTTTPEVDDNNDNSGPGNAHEAEDNRGPGNAHDDNGADDNSGSGHSGSGHSGSDD